MSMHMPLPSSPNRHKGSHDPLDQYSGEWPDILTVKIQDTPEFKEALKEAMDAYKQSQTLLNSVRTAKGADEYLYVARVTLEGSATSAWSFFTHVDKYTDKDFMHKVDEACRITNGSRIKYRKEQLQKDAKNTDPQLAQKLFASDADFFETVMMDKFGFKALRFECAHGVIASSTSES